MLTAHVISLALATMLAFMALGGGFYEFSVVDPAWPKRPELIQASRGGLSRVRFWLPAHVAFEVALLASLGAVWSLPAVRQAVLVALACQATVRVWSFAEFIPQALAFERAAPGTVNLEAARRWTRRSVLRLPLHAGGAVATLVAFALALQAAPP